MPVGEADTTSRSVGAAGAVVSALGLLSASSRVGQSITQWTVQVGIEPILTVCRGVAIDIIKCASRFRQHACHELIIIPASTLKVASTQTQFAIRSWIRPSGPKPVAHAGFQSRRVDSSHRQSRPDHTHHLFDRDADRMVMVGGHCRFAQPIEKCGTALTSFE